MAKSGIKIEDLRDFDGWTTRLYAITMRKLIRIQRVRQAASGGSKQSIAALVHEAVREMPEP